MSTPAQLFVQSANADVARKQEIEQQQKIARQAKLSAIVGDSLNALPLPKDDNGNPDINNPAYNDILQRRQKLIGSLLDEYTPTQHANVIQRIGGLITGNKQHAMPHPDQPLPAMGTGPHALAAQQGTEQAAQAAQELQQNQIPQQPVESVPVASHPFTELPPGHPAHKITEGLAALKNHLAAFAHPIPSKPDQSALANQIATSYQDPAQLQFERNKELYGIRGQYQVEAAKARGANVRPFHIGDANTTDAIAKLRLMPGIEYQDETGEPITEAMLAEAPPYMKLAEFRQGPNTFYKLIDQRSKETNIGGIKYQVNELGAIKPEASTALGNQTADKETMHQVPGMNPGEVINLHGAQAPVRTGMTQAPPPQVAPITGTSNPENVASVAPPTPPNPTLKVRPISPTTTPTLPPSPSQAAIAAKTNAGRSQSKQIPAPTGPPMPPPFAKGTMLSQGRSAQPVVAAMSVVAANVFGGGKDKPIWENAWMYDKPEIRKALNNALTLNALANPGTEDNPTLMQTLATAVGATQWSQEQINAANVQARQELQRLGGDAALEQFAREAALQEDLSALRTATKASAAQGSIRTLVRAAPVYNISSAQDFRNQLGTTLNTAAASMRGYPAINPEYVKWWDRGVAAAKGGPVSVNAPKVPTETPARPANVPDDYVFKNGPKGRGWYAPTAAK